jgi:hypothetical protein
MGIRDTRTQLWLESVKGGDLLADICVVERIILQCILGETV